MANIIEIRVRATDETGPTYDAVKAKAMEEGYAAGQAFSSAYARAAQEDNSPVGPSRVTSARTVSLGPTPEEIEEQKQQIASLRQEIEETEDAVRDLDSLPPPRQRSVLLTPEQISEQRQQIASLRQDLEDEVADATDDSVRDVLDPSGPAATKLKQDAKTTGRQAGENMGDGMSPLIATAIGTAAAVGAPALLAGMGTAFVGISALALKSNQVIAADYRNLGKEAESALTQAVAPLAGTMHQALVGLEGDLKGLQPQLTGLFVAAEPDITAVASGVGSFAKGVLPGLSSALSGSQGIVQDFSNSLGGLGQGVGGFFQGLTRDAYTTGQGLESLVTTVGHLASTLGSVLGSAASVGSTALMGLDPVLNVTLSAVQKMANPGTVGAVAGLFGAMKLGGEGGALTSGLGSISKGLGKFAEGAEESEGAMGALKGAAGSMSGAFGSAADVVGGPWMLAIGAGIGLATGLAGALINAAHASDAVTLSQQGLQQAIQQDNGAAGSATAAYIAQQSAANGMSDAAQSVGVSMSTWTQAVLGNKDAQAQVTSAVEKANQAQLNQQAAADGSARSTGKFSGELQDATSSVAQNAAATNRLTDAHAKILNSMNAETQQVAAAIAADTKYEQALNSVDNAAAIFNATLTAGYKAQVASAQQSALNTVSALDLGSANTALNDSLYKNVTAFTLAQGAGNSYEQALNALSGTTSDLLGAEAAFTTSLAGVSSAAKSNGTSLDINKAAGAANITMFRQVATAANQAAGAVEENEKSTKGAQAAWNDANAKLSEEKAAFINAAVEAGYNKDQVTALANALFKIPKNVSSQVTVSGLSGALSNINVLTSKMNSISAHYRATGGNVGAYAHGGNIGAAAAGGAQGGLTLVGEYGPELAQLPYGTSVMTNSNLNSALGMSGGVMRLQLDVASAASGSGLDGMFIKWLRASIRGIGGSGPNSVQRALGQVS